MKLNERGLTLAQLIVRQLDDAIADKLKARAREHALSMEEEHRRILRRALLEGGDETLKDLLLLVPEVGEDADFERIPQPQRKVQL